MGEPFHLSPETKAWAHREAQRLLEEVSGVVAVVVATVDGFDVGSAMKQGDPERVAAMASSIFAISAVVSQEASLGLSRSVTIDTDKGLVVPVLRDADRRRPTATHAMPEGRIPPVHLQHR